MTPSVFLAWIGGVCHIWFSWSRTVRTFSGDIFPNDATPPFQVNDIIIQSLLSFTSNTSPPVTCRTSSHKLIIHCANVRRLLIGCPRTAPYIKSPSSTKPNPVMCNDEFDIVALRWIPYPCSLRISKRGELMPTQRDSPVPFPCPFPVRGSFPLISTIIQLAVPENSADAICYDEKALQYCSCHEMCNTKKNYCDIQNHDDNSVIAQLGIISNKYSRSLLYL